MATRYHMCLDCSGGIKNAKNLIGCITVDGKTLNTEKEIKQFLQHEIDIGHRVIPYGDCDTFDWQTGCKGHPTEDGSTG